MKIPVFVSCPTALSAHQQTARTQIVRQLDRLNLEPHALGRSDYPSELPLREVLLLARHCSGGLILGFEQYRSASGVEKPGTEAEQQIETPRAFPTPWNHIEAGILFGLSLPLLIFREPVITGGVFDPGVTDVFIHDMPAPTDDARRKAALRELFLKWHALVRNRYYSL
jgi:hypothetical protein